eukprot:scaffold524_cov357-Pavlova_lutheri.AAC.3
MAASSPAEDRVSNLDRSSSVPFTAGMCIVLRGTHGSHTPRSHMTETHSCSIRDSTSQGPGLEQRQQ